MEENYASIINLLCLGDSVNSHMKKSSMKGPRENKYEESLKKRYISKKSYFCGGGGNTVW